MALVFFHESVNEGKLLSPLPVPLAAAAAALLAEPPPPPPAPVDTFGIRITPSLLLIIVIVAAIFFVSGLLHLLVRCLLKPTTPALGAEPADAAATGVTVFQGQLQQLFHLHDAGVDQSFIDALPVFHYKSIVGAAKDPFDCAVCLCEFEAEDELRLLPKCSHAFHLECIDTWLLSHSTCPLCRRCLLADFSPAASGCSSAVVLVLESGRSESLRESASERAESIRNLNFSLCGEDDLMSIITENDQDEAAGKEEEEVEEVSEPAETKVVTVKLGKFRSTAEAAGGRGQAKADAGDHSGSWDQRRCLSMGSYHEYVVEESAMLRVAIHSAKKKPALKKVTCHRVAMSECDCNSRRHLSFRVDDPSASTSARLSNRESFSVSKIWMQSGKEESSSSRRAFSFRWSPSLRRTGRDEPRQKKRPATSEFDELRRNKIGSTELDSDVEGGSCNKSASVSRLDETPSFARKLASLLGRQNRIEDHA